MPTVVMVSQWIVVGGCGWPSSFKASHNPQPLLLYSGIIRLTLPLLLMMWQTSGCHKRSRMIRWEVLVLRPLGGNPWKNVQMHGFLRPWQKFKMHLNGCSWSCRRHKAVVVFGWVAKFSNNWFVFVIVFFVSFACSLAIVESDMRVVWSAAWA